MSGLSWGADFTAKGSSTFPMRPLFYENPVALHPAAHGGTRLAADLNYGFARTTNAIPISLAEIPRASLSYPIAFTVEGGVRPVAVMGLHNDENLFVDADGHWVSGAYVPAYVRRFPFILAEYGEGEGVQLCIEDHPDILRADAGHLLFAEGEPSSLVLSAFELCQSLRAADIATSPFVEALIACGVLEPREAAITLPDGNKISMAGFAGIDEERFGALPDKAFVLLRKQGWLDAIYAQLRSNLNWSRLADMVSERKTQRYEA